MWGRYYWGKKSIESERDDNGGNNNRVGIVVVFAWLSSEEKHLKPYLNLYSSLGWSSLVCHSQFPTLFFPERAAALADGVIKELVKELKIKPVPVVFSSFSGGPKGCTYKVLQLIERACKGQLIPEEYQLVLDCLCGQIYDSCPVDFKSDFGTKFVLHPSVLKMPKPPRVLKWTARALASSLDALFISNFQKQRKDFWDTLYNSSNVGPILILSSETDDLAPFSVIYDFAKNLEKKGADVSMMKWDISPHVGHYKHHPDEYKTCVTNLLQKAATLYSNRKQLNSPLTGQVDSSKTIPEPDNRFHKAASNSNETVFEYQDGQEDPKPELFQIQKDMSVRVNGVLGRVLLGDCDPKDIEGWELKHGLVVSGRNNHGFNPIKCIIRSRL